MATKKTLEEYQIQEIARDVFKEHATDFIRRGEYDVDKVNTTGSIASLTKDVGALQKAEEERVKDKKTLRGQVIGLALALAVQAIMWIISFSNGFKLGD